MKPNKLSLRVLGITMATFAVVGATAQEKPAVTPNGGAAATRQGTAPPTAAAAASLPTNSFNSVWFLEVAKLVRSKTDENVILAFIENTDGTFNLGPDQIIYLKQLGASSQVMSEMMSHDRDVSSGAVILTASTTPVDPALLAPRLLAGPPTASPSGGPETKARAVGAKAQAGAPELATSGGDDSIVVREPETEWPLWFDESSLAPEQSNDLRVRLPYPVRLTDPIIVLRTPCL